MARLPYTKTFSYFSIDPCTLHTATSNLNYVWLWQVYFSIGVLYLNTNKNTATTYNKQRDELSQTTANQVFRFWGKLCVCSMTSFQPPFSNIKRCTLLRAKTETSCPEIPSSKPTTLWTPPSHMELWAICSSVPQSIIFMSGVGKCNLIRLKVIWF